MSSHDEKTISDIAVGGVFGVLRCCSGDHRSTSRIVGGILRGIPDQIYSPELYAREDCQEQHVCYECEFDDGCPLSTVSTPPSKDSRMCSALHENLRLNNQGFLYSFRIQT